MNVRQFLTVLTISVLAMSCSSSSSHELPGAICGTPINPAVTRPLLTSTEDFSEFTRVDRSEAITAPCVLLSGRDPVLDFRFSWDDRASDLMYLAKDTGSISGIREPREIDFTYKTIVGTDGAISTTPCKTKGGDYFTLTLQVPQISLMDQTHRKDIERFMRAYFPATLKTLGCK
ncbi:hypothetical protein [Streptomyces sp. N50]|uniref:hypothetical protein n=1 Tax=Streptomyces sp. N50 TaxID=3081765 RepID=UPI0029624FB9|nr:hypothetical protein [Streptomyces sp. N50]WOX11847.1 hypothetical protein R2B38_24775 [Streptomyces sp. N50]